MIRGEFMFVPEYIAINRAKISTPAGDFICYRSSCGPRPWTVIGSGLFFVTPEHAAGSMRDWSESLLRFYYRRANPVAA